jgi:hypothetical protein
VIAHLAGNTRLEQLVSKYGDAIAGYPQADIDKFEIVVRYLREHHTVD